MRHPVTVGQFSRGSYDSYDELLRFLKGALERMKFRGRDAVQIENSEFRVTVLREGGHIAEILHKASDVNPLWLPPWPSIEPSSYNPGRDVTYGQNEESSLLAGIMGHSLCLDLFGPPSHAEASAGLPVHGEVSVCAFDVESAEDRIEATAVLHSSHLKLTRRIQFADNGDPIRISETVENLDVCDRPIGWTQHVTIGPPFLENGATQFAVPAARSRVYGPPAFGESDLIAGSDFTWPSAPRIEGGAADLGVFSRSIPSSRFTTHLMNQKIPEAYFAAYSPTSKVLCGYRWSSVDFPWIGIWEENRSRLGAPWNGRTLACGFEFGVSPFPETRRQMIERGRLFDIPAFRWISARSSATVQYSAFIRQEEGMPRDLDGGVG
jgi:hypothetical protein